MVKVNFLGPINKDSLEIDASNLQELRDILLKHDDLKEWLEISAIAVNDDFINSLDYELKNNDIVNILPPVCGG